MITSGPGPIAAVVRLGPADVDDIVALERKVQRRPWSRAQIDAEIPEMAVEADRAVFGAKAGADGALVGWLALRRMLDEAWILQLGVDPAARRRGIAGSLVDAAGVVADAWGADLWLEVRASNDAARALYLRRRFEIVAARKGYYPPSPTEPGAGREDAVLMRRPRSATREGSA